MATKTVTIKESAYEALNARKRKDESFSDVIERISKRRSLMDLMDVISEEEGEDIADEVEKVRSEMESELENESTKFEEVVE
jgi:predicted CopG family antitoxin